jgi:hypothetical protein
MVQTCESSLPTSQFLIQEPCQTCHRQFIRRSSVVTLAAFPNQPIVITVRYEHCIMPQGFSLGKHVYSITLLPGEEITLEVFRSAKLTEELAREYSSEETYSQEFATSLQEEWSTKETSNFKIGGGVSASLDLVIFKIGGHAEPEYSTSTDNFHKSFSDVSTKSSAKVNRKFDVHVDLKSETTQSTRSTRIIRNLNQCQTVTYHYFQIARRYKNTLTVVEVSFDVPPQTPLPVFTAISGLIASYRVQPPRPDVVLTRSPGEIASAIAAATTGPGRTAFALAAAPSIVTGPSLTATLAHPDTGGPLSQTPQELTLDQLLSALQLQGPDRQRFADALQQLLNNSGLTTGNVVATYEDCISTTGLYADAVVGECAACDTLTFEMQQLEKEKLALEVKRLKLDLASFYSVIGFVRSAAGGVADATVSLMQGGVTLAQEVTDESGFYGIAAGIILREGQSYRVRVTRIPPPFTTVSEPPSFTWDNKQVHVDFTVS